MKRTWVCVTAGFALGLGAAVAEGRDAAGVVFVSPVRSSVLQVLQDIVQRHPGNLLVSYQAGATAEENILHRWDGRGWVFVSNEAYRAGRLMSGRPRRIVLFGPDEILPGRLVLDSEAWVPVVLAVPDMDRASILNTAGRLLDFSPAEWRFYARRYGLDVSDENEPLRDETWFDQPHEPRRFRLPELPRPPRRQDRSRPTRREEVVTPVPSPRPAPVRTEPPAPARPEISEAADPDRPAWRRPVRAPSETIPREDVPDSPKPLLPRTEPVTEREGFPEAEPPLPSPVRAAPAVPGDAEPDPDAALPLPGIK